IVLNRPPRTAAEREGLHRGALWDSRLFRVALVLQWRWCNVRLRGLPARAGAVGGTRRRLGLGDPILQILPCLLRRITPRAEGLTRLMAAYVDGLPRRIQPVLHHASRLVVLVDDRVRQITGGITRHFGHAPRALLEVAPGFLAGTGREQQRHARAKRHSDQEGADAGIPLLDDHVGFIAHFLVSPPHDSSPWGSLSAALSLARRPCLLHVFSPSRFAPPPSRCLRSRHSGRRVPPV